MQSCFHKRFRLSFKTKKERRQYQIILTEPAWTMKDLLSEGENSGKSRAAKGGPSSLLGCSGQSENKIRFILSARGSSHTIITVVTL